MELPARTLIFSFGSGVTVGPGRGTAGGRSVTPCRGVFLIRRVSSVPWNSGIACQNLAFFIRLRSDVWPGQRDGRRLFRHAVSGCFPDSKGVFWLAFCAWDSGIACQNLDFFIRLRSDVWPGRGTAGGRSVMECQSVFLIRRVSCGLVSAPGTVELPARSLIFFIRFKSDVWPGQRDGRRLFRHAVPGCFPDSKGVFWLAFCAWNSGFACQNLDVFIGSGVTFGRPEGRQSRRATMFSLCLEQLPARPLIFSFGSGVTFGPGRGTAGGGCFVTPCQGVFLI